MWSPSFHLPRFDSASRRPGLRCATFLLTRVNPYQNASHRGATRDFPAPLWFAAPGGYAVSTLRAGRGPSRENRGTGPESEPLPRTLTNKCNHLGGAGEALNVPSPSHSCSLHGPIWKPKLGLFIAWSLTDQSLETPSTSITPAGNAGVRPIEIKTLDTFT